MNLPEITKNVTNYSVLAFIVARTVTLLSKYQDSNISEMVNTTINKIVKDKD